MKKFKLTKHQRETAARYKIRNWPKIREASREYMRKYRATRRGKAITSKAGTEYNHRNAGAIAMYNVLVILMKKDRAFRSRLGPKRTRVFGLKPWRIR